MKSLLGFVILSLVTGFSAFSQQCVSGTVTSLVDGALLPGVFVLVKGTTTDTPIDADGRFMIRVPEGGAVQETGQTSTFRCLKTLRS